MAERRVLITPDRSLMRLAVVAQVLMGSSALVALWTLVLRPSWSVVGILVMVAAQCITLVTARLGWRHQQQVGRWRERAEFLASLDEAVRRDMRPGDWLQAYVERVHADAHAAERNR